ncbi:hypothetical protein SCP_1901050 [Sparassis crispa]|uniref:Uncharacterized protein n=2 Tax=Sparassis crispa TaxID=139825 RepID=A0A401H735_9APHY|nr:hypothetical protein SCP_1901050 [Sparassis crispa]GBE90256.1 hypothetical protein SCP_1901050 [Sparassis crispa]
MTTGIAEYQLLENALDSSSTFTEVNSAVVDDVAMRASPKFEGRSFSFQHPHFMPSFILYSETPPLPGYWFSRMDIPNSATFRHRALHEEERCAGTASKMEVDEEKSLISSGELAIGAVNREASFIPSEEPASSTNTEPHVQDEKDKATPLIGFDVIDTFSSGRVSTWSSLRRGLFSPPHESTRVFFRKTHRRKGAGPDLRGSARTPGKEFDQPSSEPRTQQATVSFDSVTLSQNFQQGPEFYSRFSYSQQFRLVKMETRPLRSDSDLNSKNAETNNGKDALSPAGNASDRDGFIFPSRGVFPSWEGLGELLHQVVPTDRSSQAQHEGASYLSRLSSARSSKKPSGSQLGACALTKFPSWHGLDNGVQVLKELGDGHTAMGYNFLYRDDAEGQSPPAAISPTPTIPDWRGSIHSSHNSLSHGDFPVHHAEVTGEFPGQIVTPTLQQPGVHLIADEDCCCLRGPHAIDYEADNNSNDADAPNAVPVHTPVPMEYQASLAAINNDTPDNRHRYVPEAELVDDLWDDRERRRKIRLGKWRHASQIPTEEDVLAEPDSYPFTEEIDRILTPHIHVLSALLNSPEEVDSTSVPVLQYLRSDAGSDGAKSVQSPGNKSLGKPTKTSEVDSRFRQHPAVRSGMVPHTGDLDIVEQARINNWFYLKVPASRKRDHFTQVPEFRSIGSAADQTAFILSQAWAYQVAMAHGPHEAKDVDQEALELLEGRMFEISQAAGRAGYYQWGLDAGHHQDDWEPYKDLRSMWNHYDAEFSESELQTGPEYTAFEAPPPPAEAMSLIPAKRRPVPVPAYRGAKAAKKRR